LALAISVFPFLTARLAAARPIMTGETFEAGRRLDFSASSFTRRTDEATRGFCPKASLAPRKGMSEPEVETNAASLWSAKGFRMTEKITNQCLATVYGKEQTGASAM
jgi:hypothetical protein